MMSIGGPRPIVGPKCFYPIHRAVAPPLAAYLSRFVYFATNFRSRDLIDGRDLENFPSDAKEMTSGCACVGESMLGMGDGQNNRAYPSK